MSGRRRARWSEADEAVPSAEASCCWLCARPLGRRVEWHHPLPKSQGGRDTVPVHPICHRTIHATFANGELARMAQTGEPLPEDARIAAFIRWVAGKPPDFHAPTRRRR